MFEFGAFPGTPLKQQYFFDYLNIVYLVYKYIYLITKSIARNLVAIFIYSFYLVNSFFRQSERASIEPLRQNLEIVSLYKILHFSLLNFDS